MSNSYIIELERLRQELVSILTNKGKTIANDTPLNELIPLVSSIGVNAEFAKLCNNENFEIVDTDGEISTVWNWLHNDYKSKLTKLISPSITSIKGLALQNCTNLSVLSAPNCRLVEDLALQSLQNLTTLQLADEIIIGSWFLYDARSLTNVSLGFINSMGPGFMIGLINAVTIKMTGATFIDFIRRTSVTPYGFTGCPMLKIVDFGNTARFDGNPGDCWNGDTNIKAIVIRTPTVASLMYVNAFAWLKNNVSDWHIYVPDALVNDYKVANNWSTYAAYFAPLSEYDEEEILGETSA